MAHECPECGMICHCLGDIDDIMFETDYCEHWKICEREYDEEEEAPD